MMKKSTIDKLTSNPSLRGIAYEGWVKWIKAIGRNGDYVLWRLYSKNGHSFDVVEVSKDTVLLGGDIDFEYARNKALGQVD